MRLREAMVQQVVREQGGKKDYLSLCICDTVMDNATPQIATRRNQRDSSKCRRLALGT